MTLPYAQPGFSAITPFLMLNNADEVVDFLKQAFNAQEKFVLRQKNGKIWHAQIEIDGAMLMIGDAMGKKENTMPASLYLYVKDTDAAYRQALDAGAETVMPPADQFYGDRNAGVRDSAGNIWWIATKIEDLSEEEVARRAQEFEKKQPAEAS